MIMNQQERSYCSWTKWHIFSWAEYQAFDVYHKANMCFENKIIINLIGIVILLASR